MEQNILFQEQQRFTQWWLYAGLIPVLGLEGMLLLRQPRALWDWHDLFPLIIVLLVYGLLRALCLRTVITEKEVRITFFPLLRRPRIFTWEEIDKAYVRQYRPLAEYGGWGIKGLGSTYGRAYNVKGNQGLQLELKDGKKVLIGTQRMEELDQLLYNHINTYIRK